MEGNILVILNTMKNYSTETRERMMLLLFKEKNLTFKTQEITVNKPIFYTLMNNLNKVRVPPFSRPLVLIEKAQYGNHKVYTSTYWNDVICSFLTQIREVENGQSRAVL